MELHRYSLFHLLSQVLSASQRAPPRRRWQRWTSRPSACQILFPRADVEPPLQMFAPSEGWGSTPAPNRLPAPGPCPPPPHCGGRGGGVLAPAPYLGAAARATLPGLSALTPFTNPQPTPLIGFTEGGVRGRGTGNGGALPQGRLAPLPRLETANLGLVRQILPAQSLGSGGGGGDHNHPPPPGGEHTPATTRGTDRQPVGGTGSNAGQPSSPPPRVCGQPRANLGRFFSPTAREVWGGGADSPPPYSGRNPATTRGGHPAVGSGTNAGQLSPPPPAYAASLGLAQADFASPEVMGDQSQGGHARVQLREPGLLSIHRGRATDEPAGLGSEGWRAPVTAHERASLEVT